MSEKWYSFYASIPLNGLLHFHVQSPFSRIAILKIIPGKEKKKEIKEELKAIRIEDRAPQMLSAEVSSKRLVEREKIELTNPGELSDENTNIRLLSNSSWLLSILGFQTSNW
ncbi:hypothetical protein CDAR_534271 [Caerostris darwini]|uniref:Uncharacterized protein n=1 Tax=Caerostris darwini TaxID=1538125 RepID=A0AAV4SA32_9ARAC|nr:hypothetical protein CDAR_534271 [Caerostris darwini]